RVSHAPDRYRQSGSSNRAVERAHWSVDGTLQNAPERPRLAPRTSHDGEPASWPARLPEEVRLGTVQDRYFQARHPQITARPAPCGAGSQTGFPELGFQIKRALAKCVPNRELGLRLS